MENPSLELSDLAKFYLFAVWMVGDRASALQRAAEIIREKPNLDLLGWACCLLEVVRSKAPPRGDVLSTLDDLLRTDLTITVGDHPAIQRDPRRLRVLQWELKRSCLLEVMSAVAPGPRATFLLIRMLGFTAERVAAAFGIMENSLDIHLGRAERVLDNYLSARCQHIAPSNICHCDTRLGVALAKEFVRWPEDSREMPDAPVFTVTHSNPGSLYRSLPRFTPDPAAMATLTAAQQSSAG